MSFWAPWTHLWGYSLEPGVWIPVLLSGFLYWRGQRQMGWARNPQMARSWYWRGVAFYVGLAVILFALEGPIDYLANLLFWVHMVEHCLLQVVAAPLIVVGAPWLPMWRGLPLKWRRAIAPGGLRFFRWTPIAAIGRFFRQPLVGLGALAITFWTWHVPYFYDLSLANQTVHDFEHLTLLVGGLIYWSQTVDSPPLHRQLDTWHMAGYLVGGAATMWVVALTLGLAAHPWYSPYYDMASRPGGITALQDQQYGAGVAWVPAAMPFEIMLDVIVYKWLVKDEKDSKAAVVAYRLQRSRESDANPPVDV